MSRFSLMLICRHVLVAVVMVALLTPAFGAEIRNPGFEGGRKSHEGVGWWWFSTADSCDFDTEVFHSGKRSIRLSVDDSTSQKPSAHWSRYALLSTPLQEPKPDTIYTVRCFVKTEMSAGQAGLAILCKKEKMEMPDRVPVKFLPLTASTDGWREVIYTFKTPADLVGVTLYCAVEGFTGRAWFDDFSIQEGVDLPTVPQSTEWDDALLLNNFILVGDEAAQRQQPEAQSEVRLLSSGDRLLIRGICFEPEIDKLKLAASGRDSAVWADDSMEIFLDSQRSRSTYYHFIINANGALYDANGKDADWSPPAIEYSATKAADSWSFEISIPYTAIGYGAAEATATDKPMALALFRCRRTTTTSERSSWQLWQQQVNFHNVNLFAPVTVGSETGGGVFNFLTRGQAADALRPPLAWRLEDPLYEELMGAEPLHPEGGTFLNIGFRGSTLSEMETAFALQHGMKKHYAETDALKQKMRSVYNTTSMPPADWFEKYDQRIGYMSMPKYGGAFYAYSFRPNAPMFKHYAGAFFYPDPRVQESYAKHLTTLLKNHADHIEEITLGHEDRQLYFMPSKYDEIRTLYMEENPASWQRMEEEAKERYGHGKFGFPVSYAEAKPLERMVFQRFLCAEYYSGIRALAVELRKIKPDIRLISELDASGVNPYFYEYGTGIYDNVCQQMYWGNGVNRQSVAFNCKFLSDLAKTPARGGPHIEHYFVSLTAAEANEVVSSVFRVGGTSLQLWLNDWFGKTLGDYYGAPERFHEIVSLCQQIATMRKLNFPQPDCAIFYGNVSQTARSWICMGGVGGGHEEAFTVLGPRVRSWFNFLSDTQLELGQASCDSFKVIYDPGTRYLQEEVYQQLCTYVSGGGTLVVADPASYSLKSDGSPRDTSALLGVAVGDGTELSGEMLLQPHPEFANLSALEKISLGQTPGLRPLAAAVTTLAVAADGTPLLTQHKVGQGRVITFASSPFKGTIYGAAPWWEFFRRLQLDLGCVVGHDIWRFRFPLAATPPPAQVPPNLYCLTGNSWYYANDAPVEGPNVAVACAVAYQNPPDQIADTPGASKLFNRKAAMTATPLKKLDDGLEPWLVAWQPGPATTIRLTFEKEVTVEKVRLWLSGDMPEIAFGVVVADAFKLLQTTPAPVGEQGDVRQVEIDIPATKATTFELHLGERNAGVVYLSELELWGAP